MKKIFPTLCLTLLLVGCVDNSPLRSDIEEFVASFSLQEAMLTYTDMGYTKTKTTNKEQVTVEVETVDIRSTDMTNFSYDFTKVTKVDGTTQKEEYSRISTTDGHYYLTTDQNPDPYEIPSSKCAEYIEDFFYGEVLYERYHQKGMYYGDIVLDNARRWQDFIVIDSENNLLVMTQNDFVIEDTGKASQKITVNRIGMLVHNEYYLENTATGESASTVIDVYKL